MPPRKSHKKSRAGCLRCKQRKVKCDELHPACGNCTKHGVACDFEDPTALSPGGSARTPASRSPPARSPASTNGSMQVYRRSPSASMARSPMPMYTQPSEDTLSHYHSSSRATELRLLHNYTTLTAKTLAASNNALTESAWQIHVPTLAFANPCLMDALLAVSALHMRTLTPNDGQLVRLFHGYMASSLAQYTQTLSSGVNEQNAEALFTTSALIAFQASACRRFTNESNYGEVKEPYQLPVQWFHSFQGVKTVVLTSWRWLRMSPHVRPIIAAQPALSRDTFVRAPEPFSHLLATVQPQVKDLPPSEASEIKQAYEHSVAYLNWAHAKPEKPRILGFPATVSRRFIQLIDEKDSRALVIIACFFAMTRRVEDAWWLEGVAKKEVLGILSLLDPEWWGVMEWPLLVVNQEGEVTDDTWHAALRMGGVEEEFLDFGEEDLVAKPPGSPGGSHIDLLAQIGDAQQIMEVACGRVGGRGMVQSMTLTPQAEEMAMVDLLD